MPGCSLVNVNDSFCHTAIRQGNCPGLAQGACLNEEAFARLALKHAADHAVARREIYEEQARTRATLGCAHFVRNDDPGFPAQKDVADTRQHIVAFMRRHSSRVRRQVA